MSQLCLTCENRSLVRAVSVRKAHWVDKHFRGKGIPLLRQIKPATKNFSPTGATLSIKSYIPTHLLRDRKTTRSRKTLYWASNPSTSYVKRFKSPQMAYDSFENHGVATVSKDGKLICKVRAPQIYREAGKVFPAHVHYVFTSLKTNCTEWDRSCVYSMAAYPGHFVDEFEKPHHVDHIPQVGLPTIPKAICSVVSPAEVKRNLKQLILVNALPEPYQLDPLPTSTVLRVPYKSSNRQVRLAAQTIGLKPYVVFCAHSKCSAASQLISRMISAGALNVFYMPLGIRGWK